MSKKAYRFTRQHGKHATGEEIELTEAEAIRLNNEAPGVLERVEPKAEPAPRQAKPIITGDL